ncbi:MAG: PqqD family peptide modification chaperone [Myxococcales bacterium]|nr:MAG: PqqD family peptide modification chaperone [Myxococcales bacterium]
MATARILSLIDGQRSLADLAQALGAELGVEPPLLHEPLRQVLQSLLC